MRIDFKKLAILTALLLLLVKGFLLLRSFKSGLYNDGTRETVNVETRVDTIHVVTEKVIIREPEPTQETKPVIVPLDIISNLEAIEGIDPELVKNRDSIKIDLPINRYRDSIQVGGAGLKYDLLVAGYLQPGPRFEVFYPEKYQTTTVTKTQVKNRLFDVMLGGGVYQGPFTGYELGGAVVTKRFMIDAGYGSVLVPNSSDFENKPLIRVGAKYRIFGR